LLTFKIGNPPGKRKVGGSTPWLSGSVIWGCGHG
jgi:hypothetical protein